ncbi:hypothetical protein HDU86_007077 [Geranomyces michiganensis]|nr:hypothetical protein HDU86_007077 [Geranomyces michiganensis]
MTGRRPSLLQQGFTPRQFPNYDTVHHLSDPFKPAEVDSPPSASAATSRQYKVPALDAFGGPRMSVDPHYRVPPLDAFGGPRMSGEFQSRSPLEMQSQYRVPPLDGFGGPRMSGEFQSRSPFDTASSSSRIPMVNMDVSGPPRMESYNRNPMLMRRNPMIGQRSMQQQQQQQNPFQLAADSHTKAAAGSEQRPSRRVSLMHQHLPEQHDRPQLQRQQERSEERQQHHTHRRPQQLEPQSLQSHPHHHGIPLHPNPHQHQQQQQHDATLSWSQQPLLSQQHQQQQHVATPLVNLPLEFQDTAQYSRPFLTISQHAFDPSSLPLASPALSTTSNAYSNTYPDLFSPVERTSLDYFVTPADQLLHSNITSPFASSFPATTPVAQSNSNETPAPVFDSPAQYPVLDGGNNPLADFDPSSGWLDSSWDSFRDVDITEQFSSSPTSEVAVVDNLLAPPNQDAQENACTPTDTLVGIEQPSSACASTESPTLETADRGASSGDDISDDVANSDVPAVAVAAADDDAQDPTGEGDIVSCPQPGCSRTFLKYVTMRAHYKTHTVAKPHQCPICQICFRRNHDLKRHSRLHTKERPYRCATCPEAYARSDALKRHNKYPCGAPHPRTKRARAQASGSGRSRSSSSNTGAEALALALDADAEAEASRAMDEMQLHDPRSPPLPSSPLEEIPFVFPPAAPDDGGGKGYVSYPDNSEHNNNPFASSTPLSFYPD